MKKQSGAVSIMFVSGLLAIIALIVISANTAYLAMQKTRLEHAIESSVVAIALASSGPKSDKLTLNDYREIVISLLAAFFPDSYQDIQFTINPPAKKSAPYTISADKKIHYLLASWLTWSKIATSSDINIGSSIGVEVVQGNIEIALIMDNSGSMFGDIDSLKDSAKLFINQLIDNRANDEQVYISVIPFSNSVNIGKQYLHWMSNSLSGDAQQYGACTKYRYPSSPATEIIANAIVPPLATSTAASSKKFPGYAAGPFAPCAETPLMGLSNNKTVLIAKINAMVASGATDGDHGIIWGWRTLAEEWQGLWPNTKSRPLKKTEVKKVALFFSDGASISHEQEIFLPVCEAMKKQGIEIYTLQFSSPNNSMKACASNAAEKQYYYYASNQQQLKQAFDDISQSVGFELKLKKL
jgi:hypothetical protein